MSMNDLGGTHRHPNEPDMGVRRVLPCVKCGDRHTVDVTAILEEGRRSNRPADASGVGEGLDVVRLSQAFLRVNTFMDGIAASQAAGEIAAAYADLDPGRLASDSEPASESPGADSIATGKDD